MPNKADYVYEITYINVPQTVANNYECDYLSGKNVESTSSGFQPSFDPKPLGTGTKYCAHYGGNTFKNRPLGCRFGIANDIMTVNVDSINLTVSYSQISYGDIGIAPQPGIVCNGCDVYQWNETNNCYDSGNFFWIDTPEIWVQTSGFTDFDNIMDFLMESFKNIRLFVDGEDWTTPTTYNWQSVPSISGKNGILQSLVQIKEEALNDGEPVSEATVLSFDSLGNINIPSVIDEQMPVDPSDVTSVTATYLIPALENGTYEGIKLLVKKGSIPTSEEDADKVVNLDEPTSILRIDSKSVGNLDEDSHYYFVVKLVDEIGTEATSDPKDIWTSHSEGWTFDYTGEIQTFTAPKTGIYQLETWGAQGGDATDGTLTARGGYGAYAVGEVLLQQGETIYINVGGQNGYGGGGNYVPPYIEIEPSILDNNIFVSSQSDAGYSPASYGANYYITLFPDTVSHFDNAKCILTGQQNKSAYTHTTDGQGNDIMSYSNNNTYSISVLAIPLGDLYDVSKIAFSYKIDTSGYEYKFINMWTANINTLTGSVIESVSIFADNESKSWTDTEVNVNKQMNYLIVQTCNGQNALKDIKVYL